MTRHRLLDGAFVDVSVTGDPEAPAILLNRPLGGSMKLWGAFATELARSLRVIAFDPRGVGASDEMPRRWSTRAMARDAIALLDVLDVSRAHVFGISLGGMVSMWIAADAPLRVDHLILASTLPRSLTISTRALRHGIPLFRALLRGGPCTEVSFVRQVLSPGFRRAEPERVRAIEDIVLKTRTKTSTLLRLARIAVLHEEPPLDRIAEKTLLMSGGRDTIAGGRSREELLLGLPKAEFAFFPNAGHDLSLEEPVALAERVLAFVAKP